MNIALLIDTLFGGGSERILTRLACGLAKRGHRVFVYCLKHAGTDLAPLHSAGVVVREAHSAGRDPLLAWRLARWLKRDRVQIVHAHSCAALVWVFPAAKLRGLPLVHVRHGWPLRGRSRYARLADRLDRFVERVVIVCESGRDKLPRGRVARDAIHIPNGVDEPEAIPPPAARQRLEEFCARRLDGPVLLSVANIRPEKDVCGLLRAFALLRRSQPDATLVCVGARADPACWGEVERVVRTLRLEDAVVFPGHVPDAQRLMSGADALVLASRTEGMPNVILEAMARRLPIVATAVGDVGLLPPDDATDFCLLRHTDTALLVPPGNPSALATALEHTLTDPVAARQRAARAREHCAQRYTTEQMVARYEQTHTGCLQRPKTRQGRGGRAARPAVLMLGPAPPHIGGMVTAIDALMASRLRAHYALHRSATTTRPAARPTRRGPLPRSLDRARSVVRHLRTLAAYARTLIRQRIDLVHIHTCSFFTFYRNLLDLALAKLLGRKVVLHIRGGRFACFCAESGRWRRRLIRRACETADAVVVLSEGWRKKLAPFVGKARVVVIPNGVTIPARPITPADDARGPCRFLFLGPLTEAKGLTDLIEASRRLHQENVPFHLVVAGPAPNDDEDVWRQRVRDAGIEPLVTFTGPVRGLGKARLLRLSDCLVHPSHSEGLPFTILEAAAAGLPVCATAVGAVPEVFDVGRSDEPLDSARGRPDPPDGPAVAPSTPLGAGLVPPRNAVSLAREMARLAADASLRRRIGTALRTRVATHYNRDREVGRIARLYEMVLQQPARRGPERQSPPSIVATKSGAPENSSAGPPSPAEEPRVPAVARQR